MNAIQDGLCQRLDDLYSVPLRSEPLLYVTMHNCGPPCGIGTRLLSNQGSAIVGQIVLHRDFCIHYQNWHK
jgi:hypothetical protein